MAIVAVSGSVDISINVSDRFPWADLRDLSRAGTARIEADLANIRARWRATLTELWPVDTGTSLRSWESRVAW